MAGLRGFGRSLFYIVMGLLLVVSVMMGVIATMDADEPVYWGRFLEERCEPTGRRFSSCTSVGTWRSYDGAIVLEDVQLDGKPGPDGRARASYRPTGVINDANNNIVHTDFGTSAQLWFPRVLGTFVVGITVFQSRKWRRQGRRSGLRRASARAER